MSLTIFTVTALLITLLMFLLLLLLEDDEAAKKIKKDLRPVIICKTNFFIGYQVEWIAYCCCRPGTKKSERSDRRRIDSIGHFEEDLWGSRQYWNMCAIASYSKGSKIRLSGSFLSCHWYLPAHAGHCLHVKFLPDHAQVDSNNSDPPSPGPQEHRPVRVNITKSMWVDWARNPKMTRMMNETTVNKASHMGFASAKSFRSSILLVPFSFDRSRSVDLFFFFFLLFNASTLSLVDSSIVLPPVNG